MDMLIKGIAKIMTLDWVEWRKRIYMVDPNLSVKDP